MNAEQCKIKGGKWSANDCKMNYPAGGGGSSKDSIFKHWESYIGTLIAIPTLIALGLLFVGWLFTGLILIFGIPLFFYLSYLTTRLDNNPFRMVGSWIGYGLSFIIPTILLLQAFLGPEVDNGMGNAIIAGLGLFLFAISSIASFLVGWGVHCLIRRLRK